MHDRVTVHPTADVDDRATVGPGTTIWHECQVRAGAVIGRECVLGKGVYVDEGVRVGDRVKLQNGVSLFQGVVLEDGVFCGPHVAFTNDLRPRAVNPDGSLKVAHDWTVQSTLVRSGASIGANATVRCGITIGRWAMAGAGAVITRDVPDHALVVGTPARLVGYVCACGELLPGDAAYPGEVTCAHCGRTQVINGSAP